MTFQRIVEMAIKPPFKYYVVKDGYFGNAVADKFCFNSLSKAKECAEQLFLETKKLYSIYSIKYGGDDWNEEVYSVTDIGKDYVVDLWLKKKKENKPSRSKRRYQVYLDWSEGYEGSFKNFLDWLKITEKDELYYPEECEVVREYKKRWQI